MKIQLEVSENIKHKIQFATGSGTFKDKNFEGSFTLSSYCMLITLDGGKQYQVKTIDILKAIKKSTHG